MYNDVYTPVQVDSCFGGMAIYRRDIVHDCHYDYISPIPPHVTDCEHVAFHRCIRERNNGTLYTNPNM